MKYREEVRKDTKAVSGTAVVDPSVNDFLKSSGVRSDMDYFEESMTRQEFADECDINTIMKRYEMGGAVSHVNRAEPQFLDCTLFPGMQASLDSFIMAEQAFNALPAVVRREFDNDPRQFVDFAMDAKNLDRMREWGLAPPVEAPPAPIKVEMVNPPGESSIAPAGAPKPA